METNPYEPTRSANSQTREEETLRSFWPVWVAAAWVVFLILLLPAIPVSQLRSAPAGFRSPPAGTFLPMKLITTTLSVIAAGLLLYWPRRRRWLLLNIPIVILLSAVQWTAWSRFP
ncbi:hypothetical protein SH528x_003482 [Novipirellula sp. SH528]|uniref:hypothetical protein n=1 Tax=Novipirellula sp. SH528 TaxID=3454466 RepID=UPI003FA16749